MKFFAFDVKTTGPVPGHHQILTAAFAVLDSNLEVLENLSVKVRPNNKEWVMEWVMDLDNISIVKNFAPRDFLKESITEKQLVAILKKTLNRWTYSAPDLEREEKLVPLGHNYRTSYAFLEHLEDFSLNQYVQSRGVDTGSVGELLRHLGYYSGEATLSAMATHINIRSPGHIVTSQDALEATVAIYRWQLETITAQHDNIIITQTNKTSNHS